MDSVISQFGLESRSAGVSLGDAALECRSKYPWTANQSKGQAGLTQDAFDELCRGYYLGPQTGLVETRTFPFNAVVIDPALDYPPAERDNKGAK